MAEVEVFVGNLDPSLPCSLTVDSGCCSDWATYSTELQTAAAEYGALLIWAATGRRFGLCSKTVRPCRRDCGDGFDTFGGWGGGYYWSEGTWMPYIFNGVWRNCWCGSGPGCMSCRPSCQVWLEPPVASITNVYFSGSGIIDPSTYRVDDYQWLVRQGPAVSGSGDTDCWPIFNNFNFPASGAGEPFDNSVWQVTYLQGIPLPSVLSRAAGELACEYAKYCLGQDCRLPMRMTSLSRQGVTVSLVNVDQFLEDGLTGIVTVDNVIRAFNPYRLTSRMKIATPDYTPIRKTTWP
jgi:hypothetical protein